MSETPSKEELLASKRHGLLLKDVPLDLQRAPLPCGIRAIERYEYLLGGKGNLVILAARPGNGKTALAGQIGLSVSEHSRVLMFSLEMRSTALKERFISVASNIPIKKLRNAEHRGHIEKTEKEFENLQFTLVDESGLSVDDIIAKTYDEHRAGKLGLVIIDYIGNIKVNNEKRHLAMGECAKRIKSEIADRLKIPVLLLAQMNRGFDERYQQYKMALEKARFYQKKDADDLSMPEFRPSMSDLGESAGIEHAADVVMFLHRPYSVDKSCNASDFKVFVCKNRNGEMADFDLQFSQQLTKFFDKGDVLD